MFHQFSININRSSPKKESFDKIIRKQTLESLNLEPFLPTNREKNYIRLMNLRFIFFCICLMVFSIYSIDAVRAEILMIDIQQIQTTIAYLYALTITIGERSVLLPDKSEKTRAYIENSIRISVYRCMLSLSGTGISRFQMSWPKFLFAKTPRIIFLFLVRIMIRWPEPWV